jgi:hypothetical protein
LIQVRAVHNVLLFGSAVLCAEGLCVYDLPALIIRFL